MRMDSTCNLYAPAGATPMTIADAILRECDTETLAEVLYHIDCYMKFHGETIKKRIDEDDEKAAEFIKRFQEAMIKDLTRDFNDNFFDDAEESEGANDTDI